MLRFVKGSLRQLSGSLDSAQAQERIMCRKQISMLTVSIQSPLQLSL